MINKKTWPIKLNILKREYIPTIQPMQNDIDSNVFEITMLNDFEKYDLTGLTVQAVFFKADNTVSYLPGDITNAAEGIVEVNITSQVLAIADIVFCEVRVTGTLGEELIAPRFAFKVLPSIDITGAVESSNEFTALTQAMGDYTSIKQQFAEVIANATVDSEVINARGGKTNLNQRLTEKETEFSAQLAEIEQKQGLLSGLLTTAKTSIVAAINELFNNKANKAQPAWITPTLLGGALSMAGHPIMYRKNEIGQLELRGRIDTTNMVSNSNITIFNTIYPRSTYCLSLIGNITQKKESIISNGTDGRIVIDSYTIGNTLDINVILPLY